MTKIKKLTKALDQIDVKSERWRLRAQCQCYHSNKLGDFDFDASKSYNKNGVKYYVCKSCRKKIVLNKSPERSEYRQNPNNPSDVRVVPGYRDAIEVVDKMCDVIKLSLNPEKDKDREIGSQLADTQFFLLKSLIPLYEATLQKNGVNNGRNHGKNNNKHDFDPDGIWTKPRVQ